MDFDFAERLEKLVADALATGVPKDEIARQLTEQADKVEQG